MDGRCETCKWWRPAEYVRGDGFCELTRVDDDMRGHGPQDKRLAQAFAPVEGIVNDRGYYEPKGTPAVLLTSKNFGCVQWEAKGDGDG